MSSTSTTPSGRPRKQVVLGAHLPGVNHHTLWQDPAAGSQIAVESFVHLARTAERGFFDLFFLAEGLRLREHAGQVYERDVVGRPDTFTVLAALAGVTDHLGLAGTINTTFNEPYELARQFATLDHLSGGRAAWNVVTSFDAFTGENFRRGGYLERSQRYERAEEVLLAVRALWDSWGEDDVPADAASGRFLARPDAGRFEVGAHQFDVRGRFNVPRSPQGHPVVLQAGVSDRGREFAAANADAIFSPFRRLADAAPFYADVKARAARHGRRPEDVKILPSAGVVLGDSAADAQERARHLTHQQVDPDTAIALAEQVWNRDLSGYDPEGPLPEVGPDAQAPPRWRGRALHEADLVTLVQRWREVAERGGGLSLRETVIEVTARATFVGTATHVADAIDAFVQADGSDGFILHPPVVPTGLDEFVDTVVPLLQERGSLRTRYTGSTLRENLGLSAARTPEPVA
ncbi:NtaA/DmoA family FMN-dependent monooxygenase [Kineococcus indalonis]|uniref:NtaA/DmoA family FMN-dependent monooxygenase n=1 Tax=Kineococcus indalonis TaxID=2696566 RepID=UPI002B1BD97A|nr:NtaA/DmoA family FMN-dependent monooxygenase [Kineococcus indalonis]NAZ87859.1 NtaA/DmoA family FMN-dependent monooxygenase [Kineococcus indalonis]